MSDTIIAMTPPDDGREWAAQCARCGSTVAYGTHECLSSAKWCDANPLRGRRLVERGYVEWFLVRDLRVPEMKQ